jgi:hypothetical protein
VPMLAFLWNWLVCALICYMLLPVGALFAIALTMWVHLFPAHDAEMVTLCIGCAYLVAAMWYKARAHRRQQEDPAHYRRTDGAWCFLFSNVPLPLWYVGAVELWVGVAVPGHHRMGK